MFNWTNETVQILKDKYHELGPVKLAALLGTTLASVNVKAKRVGIQKKKVNKAAVWTPEMLETM